MDEKQDDLLWSLERLRTIIDHTGWRAQLANQRAETAIQRSAQVEAKLKKLAATTTELASIVSRLKTKAK